MAIHLYTLRSHRKTKSCNKYFVFVLHSLRTEQKDHLISFGFARDREEERVCVCVCVYLPVSCNLFAFYLGSTMQSLIYLFFCCCCPPLLCVFSLCIEYHTTFCSQLLVLCVCVCDLRKNNTIISSQRQRKEICLNKYSLMLCVRLYVEMPKYILKALMVHLYNEIQ